MRNSPPVCNCCKLLVALSHEWVGLVIFQLLTGLQEHLQTQSYHQQVLTLFNSPSCLPGKVPSRKAQHSE